MLTTDELQLVGGIVALIALTVLLVIATLRFARDLGDMLDVNVDPEELPDNVVQLPVRRKL